MMPRTVIWRFAILLSVLLFSRPLMSHEAWVDVSAAYLSNPCFTNATASWTITSTATVQTCADGYASFSNGPFHVSQQLPPLPVGRYRLSVQGCYRCTSSFAANRSYRTGTEMLTAYLYAGSDSMLLHSVYDFQFSWNVAGGCWAYGKYYPNNDASALETFRNGYYWNFLEFDQPSERPVEIGVVNDSVHTKDLCVFTNFKLERLEDIAEPVAGAVVFNEVMTGNVDEFISPSNNYNGWVELYNPTAESLYLGGCYLSDDATDKRKWQVPDTLCVLPPGGYHVFWFEDDVPLLYQPPFKLDTDGGVLFLSDASGGELASFSYPAVARRLSYARTVDGGSEWQNTGQPTPGSSNTSASFALTQLDVPAIDTDSRIFSEPFSFRVTIPEGATLRYTLDGSSPNDVHGLTSSDGVFLVDTTANYRFRLYAPDRLPSDVATRTFLKTETSYGLPVVSIVMNEDQLWNDSIGIFAKGRLMEGNTALNNFDMDWERAAHFTLFDASHQLSYSQDVGLACTGNYSRRYMPRPFRVKGSKRYGEKYLQYPFFHEKPFLRNRVLRFRNGGNDRVARLRDGAFQTIAQRSGIDLELQSFQPVVHFINGKYAGLLNMREPTNRHYVAANYGWDDDVLNMLGYNSEQSYFVECGSGDDLDSLCLMAKDVRNVGVYEEIKDLVDVDHILTYMAQEFYTQNIDWPNNNVRMFKHRDAGRYRFITFDLDFCFMDKLHFGIIDETQKYYYKLLDAWVEEKAMTFFQRMLVHDEFRRRFADQVCLMGGSVYEPSRASAILDSLYTLMAPALAAENIFPAAEMDSIKLKFQTNHDIAVSKMQVVRRLQLQQLKSVNARLHADTYGARLFVNKEWVPYADFKGQLLLPAQLKAVAPAGYRFKAWLHEESGERYSESAVVDAPDADFSLVATFERDPQAAVPPVVVNEVSPANDAYQSDYFKKSDWLELYNTTPDTVDVEGMFLSDDPHDLRKYRITRGASQASTRIPPHGHAVVWCDDREPLSQLHAMFKLSSLGGGVYLSPSDMSWTDSLLYAEAVPHITIGRYPDGCAPVYEMNVPTIGKANIHTTYLTPVAQSSQPAIPTAIRPAGRLLKVGDELLLRSLQGDVSVEVFTLAGQPVLSVVSHCSEGVSVAMLPPGCYTARAIDARGRICTTKFVK